MEISIIIAIFNRKDELEELLTSLSIQTDRDFEVIIVDDGSLIDLVPVIDFFQDKLKLYYYNIFVLIQKSNYLSNSFISNSSKYL